jgi:hypothetical protein
MAIEGPISEIVIDALPKGDASIDWPAWIQAGSAIISFMTTIILAHYAHNLQKKSQREFDLLNRPYLHIDPNITTQIDKDANGTVGRIETQFKIKNVGKSPLTYVVEKIEINEQENAYPKNPLVLLPEQEITIFTGSFDLPERIKAENVEYNISLKIKYWPLSDENQKYERYQKIQISHLSGKSLIIEDTAN